MNYYNLSLKKSGEFKVYTLLLEHQICQGQVAKAAATILSGITGEGVRTADICVDRWQETQKESEGAINHLCPHQGGPTCHKIKRSLFVLALSDLSTANYTATTNHIFLLASVVKLASANSSAAFIFSLPLVISF